MGIPIISEIDCKAAAASLGFNFYGSLNGYPYGWPGGCFQWKKHDAGQFYFNLNSTGVVKDNHIPVCRVDMTQGFTKEFEKQCSWDTATAGDWKTHDKLEDALKQCRANTKCKAVQDNGCDGRRGFRECPFYQPCSVNFKNRQCGICTYTKNFVKVKDMDCAGAHYGNYSTLAEAQLKCWRRGSCKKVYDAGCDNNSPFHLCTKNGEQVSTTGSCLYEKP